MGWRAGLIWTSVSLCGSLAFRETVRGYVPRRTSPRLPSNQSIGIHYSKAAWPSTQPLPFFSRDPTPNSRSV
jgi:hypothetical protein